MQAEALKARLQQADQLVRWPEDALPKWSAVSTDSRRVGPGALFAAYAGSTSDGHAFLPAAVSAGAVAAMVERPVGGIAVPQIVVREGRRAAAVAAALFHADPANALELLAVTGTNGKTTTVHLLRHLLSDRAPAASIGTLGVVNGEGRVLPGTGSLTTPGPVELQAVLAALRDAEVKSVVMEASSHSLDQDRIAGLTFRVAVFTNFTRDHLDYHAHEAAYLAAKLKLAGYLAVGGVEVTKVDEPAWRALPPRTERLTFGVEAPADVRGSDIASDIHGVRFSLTARGQSTRVALPLLGRFNVENALGAAAAALALGRELGVVAERLAAAPQVPGRMERVADTPCLVLRDYAHTPDALERALAALRPLTKGRLMVVFGCGGDRDRGKRPVMGQIAARDADVAILTSDNPRTEDPERIVEEVEQGMGDTPHLRIVDRRTAITRAISIARSGDTVLLAGKGHETHQVLGTERVPFDEREIVAGAVQGLGR